VGYRFTLVLSREITDEESAILQEAGCAGAIFAPDSLPTNAEVPVTKMDFDVTESPSLAEAIESALEAVKKVPDLSVPGLTVPAQPAHAEDPVQAGDPGHAEAGEQGAVIEGVVVEEKPAARKARARKATTTKPAAKKAAAAHGAHGTNGTNGTNGHSAPAEDGTAVAHDATEPVEAPAGSA
jgi:hypothetical protein